jgi:hypothetical protein
MVVLPDTLITVTAPPIMPDLHTLAFTYIPMHTAMQGGLTGGISDTGSGWVGLFEPLFSFWTSTEYYILGCIYRLLAQFGHKNWTNQHLVPCGRVLRACLKTLYHTKPHHSKKKKQVMDIKISEANSNMTRIKVNTHLDF